MFSFDNPKIIILKFEKLLIKLEQYDWNGFIQNSNENRYGMFCLLKQFFSQTEFFNFKNNENIEKDYSKLSQLWDKNRQF
jgi:hypothetical protein